MSLLIFALFGTKISARSDVLSVTLLNLSDGRARDGLRITYFLLSAPASNASLGMLGFCACARRRQNRTQARPFGAPITAGAFGLFTAPLDSRRGQTGIEAAIGAASRLKRNIMSNTSTKTRPSHRIYAVSKHDNDKKPFWHMIGTAWPHKDSKGFNLDFVAYPLGYARVVIPRARTEIAEGSR